MQVVPCNAGLRWVYHMLHGGRTGWMLSAGRDVGGGKSCCVVTPLAVSSLLTTANGAVLLPAISEICCDSTSDRKGVKRVVMFWCVNVRPAG